MSQAPTMLKRLYHRLRGTMKPSVSVLGAYPLDDDTLVLRFETSLPKPLNDAASPFVSTLVDGKDASSSRIELSSALVERCGMQLVRNAFSIPVPKASNIIELGLAAEAGGLLARVELDRARLEELARRFAELTRDAGSDQRYRAPEAPATSAGNPVTCSVVIAAPLPDPQSMLDTLESVSCQTNGLWTAAIATTNESLASAEGIVRMLGDDRVSCVSSATGGIADAISASARAACGDYALFVSQGDMLVPRALELFSERVAEAGSASFAYCDDDHIAEDARTPSRPRFKPDFNRELLYSHNYIGSCFAIGAETLVRMGDQPATLDEAWEYELALKALEQTGEIAHIASLLCHERALAGENGKGAINRDHERIALGQHFERRGIAACVERTRYADVHRTTFPPPAETPRIGIVIPNKDHVDYLKPCIESIREKAGYPNYEIVVVENNSVEPETFDFYRQLERDGRARVVRHDGPFNYSKIVNFGVASTESPLLLLLNNDTKAITDGFLAILAGYFSRPEIGIVGPRLLFPDGLVQHAGMALLESGRMGFLNQNLSPAIDRGYLNSLAGAASCSAVLGACQMVRRTTFDEVGGYLEDLAVTCNDIDFCWKVRERGLDVVYTPHAELFHKEFGSRQGDSATREREEQSAREFELMTRRWPRYYSEGDGFINPNLDQESIYYKLPL